MARNKAVFYTLILSILITFAGCSNDILDPTQIGRFRPVPVVNVILDSLGVADEPEETYVGAEDPRPEDLIEYEQDYVLGVGDTIRIFVYELFQSGTPYVNDYRITETGRISIPEVGVVQAVGLTETQLEEELKNILSPSILKDPMVTVLLLGSESRVFSIIGQGVGLASRFPLPRRAFRLSEAIAMAGGVGEHNVSYIYVSRDVKGDESSYAMGSSLEVEQQVTSDEPDMNRRTIELKAVEPSNGMEAGDEKEMLETISPYVRNLGANNQILISSAEMVTEKELEALATPEGFDSSGDDTSYTGENDSFSRIVDVESLLASETDTNRIEWVFEDGKWKPILIRDSEAVERPLQEVQAEEADQEFALKERVPSGYGWEDIGVGAIQIRVVKIPVDKLLSGDPRYDIIIRPGDRITVPLDIVGEFCINGNVNAQGYIPLVGRKMTLKQAISAAGGLNAIAWPQKVEVVRRLGRNKAGLMQEETVMVDLKKIAEGRQPDFFIKPDDWINVGTHGTSRWLAVLRNAFRATYGFGFIYDRNFASRDFGNDPFPGHISINELFD
jgi:protein involved in polysaccharide export with SLBB domain